jgi:nucleoside-diphosphate-sugar epimerase
MSDAVEGETADQGARPAVLVTGATGFLGGRLVRRLLADGHPVRALVRVPDSAREIEDRGAQLIQGAICDRAAVSQAVDGAEIVYHLAGRLFMPGVSAREYERTHVDGTQLLLDVCARSGGVRRFVHCSTTGVLGVTGAQPAREDAPLRPTNVYEATKARAELAVARAIDAGFPAVIARPGLVYGPGDLHLLGFFKAILRRRFRPIGRRPVWLHPIYIDDLTEGLVRCAEVPGVAGQCFHLAGTRPVLLSELGRSIALAAGVRPPSGYIPLAFARLVARLGDQVPSRLRQAVPLTSSRLDFLTHSRMYDVTKAARELGFAAETDLPAGAELTLDWYRRSGYLAGDPTSIPAPGRAVPGGLIG